MPAISAPAWATPSAIASPNPRAIPANDSDQLDSGHFGIGAFTCHHDDLTLDGEQVGDILRGGDLLGGHVAA